MMETGNLIRLVRGVRRGRAGNSGGFRAAGAQAYTWVVVTLIASLVAGTGAHLFKTLLTPGAIPPTGALVAYDGAVAQEPRITLEIYDVVNIPGPVVWVDPSYDVAIAHNITVYTERADGLECESHGVLVRPGVKPAERAVVRRIEGRVQWRPLTCYTGEWLVQDEVLEVVEGVSVEELVPDKVRIWDSNRDGLEWFICREVETRRGYRKYTCSPMGR